MNKPTLVLILIALLLTFGVACSAKVTQNTTPIAATTPSTVASAITMTTTAGDTLSATLTTTATAVATTGTTANSSALPARGKGTMSGGLGTSSLDTSTILRKFTDVVYASVSTTQKLDIYLPDTGDGPFPVIVAIHGGAFRMGNKTGGDVAAMIGAVKQGYAVVSVDYRLSGEAIFPAAVSDVKAAIRFIKANAATYSLDATNIAVWGDSAGGNLAAIVGTSAGDTYLDGDVKDNLEFSSAVQAVVDWFGPLDFLQMDAQFAASGVTPVFGATSSDTSPESMYIGGNITQNVAQTQKANASNYISADDPYFLIQHGSADQNVPTQQSVDFAANLIIVLGNDKVTLNILSGASHGGSQFESSENLAIVFGFLDSVLKSN